MNDEFLTEDEIRLYTYREPVTDYYTYVYHLDAVDLESRLPLDVGRHRVGYGAGLGGLEQLPRELLIKVLLILDIPTLTAFRAVNKHAMQTVNALYEYSMVTEYCPTVLRAILALDARAYGLGHLFDTLCKTACRWRCGEYGGLIHLYTCERTCEACSCYITNTPVSIQEAARITNLDLDQLKATYPSILSLPGYYGYKRRDIAEMEVIEGRLLLFDSLALHGGVAGKVKHGGPKSITRLLPDNDEQDTRLMGVISAPYLEESSDGTKKHTANWGYYCAACRCQGRSVLQKFTRRGLLEHIQEDGQILWEKGGVVYDTSAAVAARRIPDDLREEGYRARHDDHHVEVDVGD